MFFVRLKTPGGFVAALALLVLLNVSFAYAQGEEAYGPILVDEFGRLGDCEFTGRIDTFLADLSEHPDERGYIINYEPVDKLPGQKDTFGRERWVVNHINFRKFDSSRITFVRGGYSEDYRTQLYRLPVGADPPEPSGTVPEPKIDDGKTFLYDKNVLSYDIGLGDGGGGIDLEEFVLESVKVREAAEQAVRDAEYEAEQSEAGDNTDLSSEASADEEPYIPEPVSNEELEIQRFEWADVNLVDFMTSRKKSSAVLIFYADDERFDIGKLKAFIEEGRDRLAKKGGIKTERLKVEFGGYRDFPEVEFWFVPPKGKPPTPRPGERPPPQPDEGN